MKAQTINGPKNDLWTSLLKVNHLHRKNQKLQGNRRTMVNFYSHLNHQVQPIHPFQTIPFLDQHHGKILQKIFQKYYSLQGIVANSTSISPVVSILLQLIFRTHLKIQQSKNRFFAILLQFNESNKFAKTNITIAVSYGGIKNV